VPGAGARKRAMGLTHLKDEDGNGVKFTLDQGTRRDQVKVLGTHGHLAEVAICLSFRQGVFTRPRPISDIGCALRQ
jgi:hypothetical protein